MSGKPKPPAIIERFREEATRASDKGDIDQVTDWSSFNKWDLGHAAKHLLADRDHWETVTNETQDAMVAHLTERTRERDDARAEAKRWRSQCPVTAEEDEVDAVSWEQALAWFMTNGGADRSAFIEGLLGGHDAPAPDDKNRAIVGVIHFSIMFTSKAERTILDEMATATPGGDK